jgi:hypothetical protein
MTSWCEFHGTDVAGYAHDIGRGDLLPAAMRHPAEG